MSERKAIVILVSFFISCVIGVILTLFYMRHISVETINENDTTTRIVYDTIDVYYPRPKDSIVTKYVVKTFKKYKEIEKDSVGGLPQASSGDSDEVAVILPITQKTYEDSTYKAWVSGYEPNLDSIKVYQKNTYKTITQIKKTNKIIGFGLQIGVGLTPKGFQPYIGGGVNINFQ